jgi:hypothetical protein
MYRCEELFYRRVENTTLLRDASFQPHPDVTLSNQDRAVNSEYKSHSAQSYMH